MFSTEENRAQGISAVKALALASQQGQKIWTINQSNVNLALSRINLGADAENDIRNAVNAGKIATAHETRINFNGWVGEGYTLIDPQTGAGGYIISGGGNGGELTATDHLIAALKAIGLGAAMAVAALPFILFAALAGPLVLGVLTAVILATAWVSAKSSLPSDSPWRGFFVDLIGGIFVTIVTGLFFPLTVGALLFGILISLLYAIVDIFIIASVNHRRYIIA